MHKQALVVGEQTTAVKIFASCIIICSVLAVPDLQKKNTLPGSLQGPVEPGSSTAKGSISPSGILSGTINKKGLFVF